MERRYNRFAKNMQIKTFVYRLRKGTYWLESGRGTQAMDDHIRELANTGWEPMNSANDPGHVRLGKTLMLTALTGGLSLFFGASRTAQTITLTFRRPEQDAPKAVPAARGGLRMCSFCGVQTVGQEENCARCGNALPTTSRPVNWAEQKPIQHTASLNESTLGQLGFVAGRSTRYLKRHPIITAMLGVASFVCVYGALVGGLSAPNAAIAVRAGNVPGAQQPGPAPTDGSAVGPAKVAKPVAGPTHVAIDLPRLVFAPSEDVGRVLGNPLRRTATENVMDWREGDVVEAVYRRAICTFLQGRLVAIEYTFDKGSRPKTLTDALVASGLPPTAAALNRSQAYFRAEYTENPAFRNPLRCCGLVFHLVSIPLETLEEIDVVFANINLHFREWPNETQEAWQRAGAPRL